MAGAKPGFQFFVAEVRRTILHGLGIESRQDLLDGLLQSRAFFSGEDFFGVGHGVSVGFHAGHHGDAKGPEDGAEARFIHTDGEFDFRHGTREDLAWILALGLRSYFQVNQGRSLP